jgi:hypothetical protein
MAIFKKAKVIFLVMLVVFVVSFGAGYVSGKLKLANLDKIRTSKLQEFNRNLEYKVPGYGDLLQKYKNWERPKLFRYILNGKAVKAMFLIFLNNWVVANLTMAVRAAFFVPMVLYPYGRFLQGLTFAQTSISYQAWGTLICEFGGYFLVICGTLCAFFWTLLYNKFGFPSRKKGLWSGLKFFAVMYLVSGFFILFGSYIETMFMIEMSVR